MSPPRIAVVGGGISGLTAALRAAEAGADVTVFEAQSRAGGVLESSRDQGFLREHAANGFLASARDGALALCRELGVAVSPVSAAARRRWIYRGGRLRALPSNPREVATSDLLSARGKLRVLGEPLISPARDNEETVASFFRRRIGQEALAAVVEPFVTGIFAGDVDQLSLQAAFPRVAALDRRGGLAVGALIQVAERLVSSRKRGKHPSGMWAPDRGMQALVDALQERLRDRAALGTAVASLGGRGGEIEVRLADGSARRFSRAILALPAPAAAPLVRDASPELARVLEEIPFAPAAVVHMGFPRAAVSHPLDGFGFLVARGEPLRVLGCVFESSLWPGRADADHVLLRCVLGGTRDPGALELSDGGLIDVARRDLAVALGIQSAPVHANVVRWPVAIAQYTLGHLRRVERAEALARSLGIVLAGSSYRGVAVNDCIANARRAAREATAE